MFASCMEVGQQQLLRVSITMVAYVVFLRLDDVLSRVDNRQSQPQHFSLALSLGLPCLLQWALGGHSNSSVIPVFNTLYCNFQPQERLTVSYFTLF